MGNADRRHALHTVDQFRDLVTQAQANVLRRGLLLAHGAVDHGRHQGFLIEFQVGKDFRHFQTGAVTAGSVGPAMFGLAGVTIQLGSPFAGLLELLRFGQRHALLDTFNPGVDIYSAILVDRMLCSDLYHYFLSLPDTKSAMASTCAVWGNMSMIPACTNR